MNQIGSSWRIQGSSSICSVLQSRLEKLFEKNGSSQSIIIEGDCRGWIDHQNKIISIVRLEYPLHELNIITDNLPKLGKFFVQSTPISFSKAQHPISSHPLPHDCGWLTLKDPTDQYRKIEDEADHTLFLEITYDIPKHNLLLRSSSSILENLDPPQISSTFKFLFLRDGQIELPYTWISDAEIAQLLVEQHVLFFTTVSPQIKICNYTNVITLEMIQQKLNQWIEENLSFENAIFSFVDEEMGLERILSCQVLPNISLNSLFTMYHVRKSLNTTLCVEENRSRSIKANGTKTRVRSGKRKVSSKNTKSQSMILSNMLNGNQSDDPSIPNEMKIDSESMTTENVQSQWSNTSCQLPLIPPVVHLELLKSRSALANEPLVHVRYQSFLPAQSPSTIAKDDGREGSQRHSDSRLSKEMDNYHLPLHSTCHDPNIHLLHFHVSAATYVSTTDQSEFGMEKAIQSHIKHIVSQLTIQLQLIQARNALSLIQRDHLNMENIESYTPNHYYLAPRDDSTWSKVLNKFKTSPQHAKKPYFHCYPALITLHRLIDTERDDSAILNQYRHILAIDTLPKTSLLQHLEFTVKNQIFFHAPAPHPTDLDSLKHLENHPSPHLHLVLGDDPLITDIAKRLSNVHTHLTHYPDNQIFDTYLIKGSYDYYHYLQDQILDEGWGCAYRSMQTLISWIIKQNLSIRPVPTHIEIQRMLVEMMDKPPSFIGSKRWIGAVEVSMCISAHWNIMCKIIHVNSGGDVINHVHEFAHHFHTRGSPIMVGGGIIAYTLLGVTIQKYDDAYNGKRRQGNSTNSFNSNRQSSSMVKYLILDPHYMGKEDYDTIIKKGWCEWKTSSIWSDRAFYNFCLPQTPMITELKLRS